MFSFLRPRIQHLERYIQRREYSKALAAIEGELRRRPRDFGLLQRQAQVHQLSGDAHGAMEIYRRLGREYAAAGLYTRAIAVYKKILELDPDRQEVHMELADLIERDRSRDGHPLPTPGPTTGAPTGPLPAPSEAELTKEKAASALFTLFETDALAEVLTSTNLRTFQQGDILVTEGEQGASLFVLVEGEVKVFTRGKRGEHIALAELGPGDLVGEVSVLSGKPRTATITARTAVTAIELSKEDVDEISQHHPEVRTVLRKFCEQRAQHTIETLIGRMIHGGESPVFE